MPLKTNRVRMAINNKVPGNARSAKHNSMFIVVDGKTVGRVTYPHGHSGDLAPGTARKIREQLRLDAEEFDDLVSCKMTASTYEELLRSRIAD